MHITTSRPRTTVQLKHTQSSPAHALDYQSELAIQYAQAWHLRAGQLKVPAGGVVRRALALYVRQLSDDGTGQAEEFREMQRACSSSLTPPETQQEALERLQAADAGQPLPSFLDVLLGPDASFRIDAINRRADELFNEIAASPWGRRKGFKPVPFDKT